MSWGGASRSTPSSPALASAVDHLREPLWVWRLLLVRAAVAMNEGRFAQTSALLDEALSRGRRAGHEAADFMHLVFTSALAGLTGEGFETVEPGVRAFCEHGPFMARNWHATVLLQMGRTSEARAIWRSLVPHLDAFPQNAPEWIVAMAANADLCVGLLDTGTARFVYDELLPFADRQVVGSALAPMYGPVSLKLARLASLLGLDASEHLRAALASSIAMASPPYEALTRREMTKVAEVSPLTAREQEVAALVAEGLSNKQIAERLYVSVRTAENHVTHILVKLGFDSRARIASWYVSRK